MPIRFIPIYAIPVLRIDSVRSESLYRFRLYNLKRLPWFDIRTIADRQCRVKRIVCLYF